MVDDLVVLRCQTEVFATERADDKTRFDAEHFHQSVGHQSRAGNQRCASKFLSTAGMYHDARGVLFQGADVGVVDNLTASGLKNFRHRRRHVW